MLFIILIAIILFYSYISLILIKYGIPNSISDSYYSLSKELNIIFTVLFFTIAFILIVPWIELSSEKYQVLIFLSVAGIGFVGAAPLFNSGGAQTIVHYGGAGLALLCSTLWIFLDTVYWYIPLITYGLSIIPILINRKQLLFWMEMAAFNNVFIINLVSYYDYLFFK
jgi:hypothetical protein